MPRSRPVRSSFVAGEWSPLLHGRVDIEKYAQAASLIENWLVQPQGGITRRPGSHFVVPAKALDYDPVLLPFEFGPAQSYVLEMGEFYARFYALQGQIIAATITAGITNGDFAAGMTGWINTSVSGGVAAVTNGDVLVQGGVGTPVGTLTGGGGLFSPFGGINTGSLYAYHRLVLTGGNATFGMGISKCRFFEGDQDGIDQNKGVAFGNLTANPVITNPQAPFIVPQPQEWAGSLQSAGTPAIIGMHWTDHTHRITGFQVWGTRDKGFKFGDDPDITVVLQGSTDNFVASVNTLATVVHDSSPNVASMVQLFSGNIPGQWINCARSGSSPGWIGKHWSAPKTITGFSVYSSDDEGFKKGENAALTFTLQGSNDNFATTTDISTATVTDKTGPVAVSVRRRIKVLTPFAYHRVLVRGGSSSIGVAIKQISFYEAASDNGRMRLTPNAGTAAVDQHIDIDASEFGQPHSMQFGIIADQGDQLTVRVGSASDLYDFTGSIITVGDGQHTISFIPTSSPAVLQFRSLGDAIVDIDDVDLLSDQPYEVRTPYDRYELDDLNTAQVADVMWIAHPKHPLQQLIRHDNASWELKQATLKDGPYIDVNTDDNILLTPSAATGASITITASDATVARNPVNLFKPDHVGSIWRICAPGGVPGWHTWQAGVAVVDGDARKFEHNVYNAVGAGTTGTSPPVHDRGTVSDGVVNWRFRNRDGWGYVLITGYTSPSVVTARVKVALDQHVLAGTEVWREGAFSDVRGWPEVVALVGDRLMLAKGIEFYLSSSGEFDDFSPTGLDDGAIFGQLSGAIGAPIRWAVGQQRVIIGTEVGPWMLRSSAEDEALTPTNIQARQQNAAGSSRLTAFQAEAAILYFSRSNQRMFELNPWLDQTYTVGYRGTDLTILGSRALGSGAVRGRLMREPHTMIWVLREDGQLATLTYSQAESVVAWSRQILGGRVASHAIIPGANDTQQLDEVWVCVEREVAGTPVRYIEYIVAAIGGEPDAPEDAFYVDCGLGSNPAQAVDLTPGDRADEAGAIGVAFTTSADLWTGSDVGKFIRDERGGGLAEITDISSPQEAVVEIIRPFPSLDTILATKWDQSSITFTGLDHLEGETVRVLADGAGHPDCVVSGGSITLQAQAFEVVAGLPVASRYEGLSIPEGSPAGTSLGSFKRTATLIVGMVNSSDFRVGFITESGAEEETEEVILRVAQEAIAFQPPSLKTGITDPFEVVTPYDRDPRLLIIADGALPVTVTHVVFDGLSVEDS